MEAETQRWLKGTVKTWAEPLKEQLFFIEVRKAVGEAGLGLGFALLSVLSSKCLSDWEAQ